MNVVLMIVGALIGAGAMYLLDPNGGRRRRALMRDKVVRLRNEAGDTLEGRTEDLKNRAGGLVHETREMVTQRFKDEPVDDHVLEARVRSEMGRVISYSGSVQVEIRDGRVILTGPILADEVDGLLATLRRVSGVKEVVNELRVYERSGDLPRSQNN